MPGRLGATEWILTLAVLLAAAPVRGQALQPGLECSIPRSLAIVRPDDDGPPTVIKAGLFVVDITKIDEAMESFTADFVLTMRWQDPRLSAAARGASLEDCLLTIDDVWDPGVAILNQRRLWPRDKSFVTVDAEGNVSYSRRLYGEMSATFKLRAFPFDEQSLPFRFISEYAPDEVTIVGDPETTGRLPEAALAGWKLVDVEDVPHTEPITAIGRAWTQSEFTLRAQRSLGFYFWKVFVPLTLIVAMASIVFWIDPQNFGPQLGVSTASVFTLIAFTLSLGRLLPPISYLTTMDLFVYGSVVLVFAALAESVVASRLAQHALGELALQIDGYARWIYWSIFGLIVFAMLVA